MLGDRSEHLFVSRFRIAVRVGERTNQLLDSPAESEAGTGRFRKLQHIHQIVIAVR